MKIVAVIVLLLVLFPMQVNAAVTASNDPNEACDYFITDKITLADLRAVNQITTSQLTKKGGYRAYRFCLNSRGGDLEAAIGIGREFRRMNAVAIILQPAQCFSSCVFILAGAVDRGVYGAVGIHRPYAVSTDAEDYATAQAKYKRMATLAKNFLIDMNIPDELFDAMNTIPPQSLKILSTNELQQYGLNQEDPVSAEMSTAFEARKFGVSKTELLARKSKSDQVCNKYLADEQTIVYWRDCVDSVMRGEK